MNNQITVAPIDATQNELRSGSTATKKRGRPPQLFALSQADRDKRYRLKKRFIRLCSEMRMFGLDPAAIMRKEAL